MASYLRGAAALVIIGLIFDFFGTFLTGLGLRSTDPNKKYKYYRVAIYALILAMVALILAAIIYPVQFSKDLADAPAKGGTVVEPPLHLGSIDFDNDGKIDLIDDDDDDDGILDDDDPDDDNDGVLDEDDGDVEDFDGDGLSNDDDGIIDSEDPDDDNDDIPDDEDEDDDGDGTNDDEDDDDDNDGITDENEDDN